VTEPHLLIIINGINGITFYTFQPEKTQKKEHKDISITERGGP
jgi:hypothetical protein